MFEVSLSPSLALRKHLATLVGWGSGSKRHKDGGVGVAGAEVRSQLWTFPDTVGKGTRQMTSLFIRLLSQNLLPEDFQRTRHLQNHLFYNYLDAVYALIMKKGRIMTDKGLPLAMMGR